MTSAAPTAPDSGCSDGGEAIDVCVVGAGIAGLFVADRLIRQGQSVAVLEARDRVGGRLLSHSSPQGRFDLGATWFWVGEHRVAALVEELGLPVHSQHLDGDAMYHDRPQSQRLAGNQVDGPAGRFSTSAAALTDGLAARLPEGVVRLETPVHAILRTAEGVSIVSADGVVNANHVVVALPPALLAHRISIEPPLTGMLAELVMATPVWMGAITKVVATYAEPFWRSAGLAGAAISHIGPMREIHDMSGPDGTPAALFGFVPTAGTDVTEGAVRAQLVEIFGPAAADAHEIIIQNWRAEEFTSPPNVAELGAYQTFGHPLFQTPALDGRLHWASTETGTVAPGHIEGALAAAERTIAAIANHQISPDTSPVKPAAQGVSS